MKIKAICAVVWMLMTAGFLFPEKLGVLDGVLKPQMIKVLDNDLFVVEGNHFYIYSLGAGGLRLKKKVGKQGTGPGEMAADPARTIVISVFPRQIIAENRFKVLFFSREGKFLREFRKVPGIIQTMPFGENYVVLRILYGKKGENYFAVSLYTPDMKELKLLYKQKFFTFKDTTYLMPDGLNFCISGNELFIEESPEGFVIEVFDLEGNSVRKIQKQVDPIKVTSAHKEAAFSAFLDIPAMRRLRKQRGLAAAKNMVTSQPHEYAENFPAIQYILADGKNLCVKTYRLKDGKEEYMIMDTKGKVLDTVYFPKAKKVDFLVQMQGDKKYYTIHKGKFYYLLLEDDGEDEEWTIHVEPVK